MMAFPKLEDYIITEKIGSGSYSTVYKAHLKIAPASLVAIKCVDRSQLKQSGSAIDNLVTEIRLLKTLIHPHIVRMRNFTWDSRNVYIIMEYCSGGDLSKYIHKYGRISEIRVLYFLQQLACALKFLRDKDIAHMDLKPHNLLLQRGTDRKYVLKVGDFGFAQHLNEESGSGIRGSYLYMAPEVLLTPHIHTPKADLWSVGVIMYECLFGKAPYSSNSVQELLEKIKNRTRIEIPPNASISSGCQDILMQLLTHEPDKRIDYDEFFAHPYLDLEHMPTKENYDKAVLLICQAVQLDEKGEMQLAFEAYKESLLYLVPAMNSESDAIRRAALTAKVSRYMQRAEEIKSQLKALEKGLDINNDCVVEPIKNYDRNPSDKRVEETINNVIINSNENEKNTDEPGSSQDSSSSKNVFNRQFKKQPSVPCCESRSSNSSPHQTNKADKTKVPISETVNDNCHIT